jgi:UDP-hydrolysing UDP-N-acetyl-D-glucosamine 2-epimerase
MIEKKKIAVLILSRANYGRAKSVMRAIQKHPSLELQLIVGASALLYRYGNVIEIIKKDGFEPVRSISYLIEGSTLSTQVKSTGLGMIELATAFADLSPDAVFTVADRFETMATAIAASYQNIPLIHLQGGEVSGNIDDRVRHAITQLSDYHFPATSKSKKKIISMGIPEENVFNLGCPAMDILKPSFLKISNKKMEQYGGLGSVNWKEKYVLVSQHPITTSYGGGQEQILSTLRALKKIKNIQKIILWPNADAGSEDVSKGIRLFREYETDSSFSFFRNFSPEDYARVIGNATCLVGNSSSFLREGSFLGIPAVIIGNRQKNREHGANVVFSSHLEKDIERKTQKQIKHGRYEPDHIFGDGSSGKKIVKKIYQIMKKNVKNK